MNPLEKRSRPAPWRRIFEERAQSFEEYAASCAQRRSPAREAFHLQPLGRAARRGGLLDRMRVQAEAFFGLPARVGDPLPMIDEGWAPERGRQNASILIDRLSGSRPADALVYLAVVEEDLFARGLPWVFGEGNLTNGCGVLSLARLDSDVRAFKLMCHEGCHVLSIAHCTSGRCLMQGSNSLEEFDAAPAELCPMDHRKLRWSTHPDVEFRVLAAARGA
ncbi:MAG TPA: archaemetzincin [Planctomycetota bacterium]|nr:archaemetzincin [Planctomycetota bacterium]